jgi:hypothetical protein
MPAPTLVRGCWETGARRRSRSGWRSSHRVNYGRGSHGRTDVCAQGEPYRVTVDLDPGEPGQGGSVCLWQLSAPKIR